MTRLKFFHAIAGLFLALTALLPGAQINWQSSVDMYQGATDTNFVFAMGSTVIAVNPSESDNGTITLNGVSFLRADLADLETGITDNGVTLSVGPDSAGDEIVGIAGPSTFGDGSFSGNTDLSNILSGATYGHASVTFSGLTVGKSYAIQILTNDARSSRHNGYKMNLSDGTSDVPVSMTNGTAGQADLNNSDSVDDTGEESGDYILGAFIADGPTQSFEIAGELDGSVNAGRAQLNAIQLRELSDVIEAEDFSGMNGVVIEADKGAISDSIGFIINGEWAEYLVNIPEPGDYRMTISAASKTAGGNIEIISGNTLLGTATISGTGAWDNWQPFTADVTFTTAGSQTIRLNFVSDTNTNSLYNIDWFSFEIPTLIPVLVGTTPKQTMRYGMDYERLWYWTTSLNSAERDLVAKWSVVDNDIDYIRVAINAGYELTEGDFDLSAYTFRIIPMMQKMQEANPDIKFFASPRPLDEAQNNVAWQPYPQWITGSSGSSNNFSFNWEKCAEYLVRYIELMDSYGFEISYLDLTNEWNYLTPTHARDIAEYLEADLIPKGLTMPLIIAPSTWSYSQGRSWLSGVNTTRRRDAIDISASHNTNKTGTAEDFVERSHDILGPEKEVWNTELHGWKSQSGANEVLTFSFMLEAINAGFSGLSGWLAIGTTNQGHSYILNPNGTPVRNVKYFIFNKLTNTSHRGRALEIDTPPELSHTTALIKDDLLTIWAINPSNSTIDLQFDLNGRTATDENIIRTRWHTGLDVEGEVTSKITSDPSFVSGSVPGNSLCCFEIPLDPITRFEAESYDEQFGIQTETTDDDGEGQNVAAIANNDWVRYNNVTLTENAHVSFRVARPNNRPESKIEVRLGSSTGTLIGTADVPKTGAWQNWETIETSLSNTAGNYDLFLVFVEEGTSTDSDLMNLNWFDFSLGVDPITDDNLIIISGALTENDTYTFFLPYSGVAQQYQAQYSDTLTGTWTDEGQIQIGTGGQLDFEVPLPANHQRRFFRVKVSLP